MKLVDNWKSSWRWFSVHCLWIAAAIPNVWVELPADLKSAIPPGTMGAIAGVVAVCGIVGRLVDQEKKQ
jgi:hypothetical protein